jgi:hypothetical protein
VTCSLSAIGVLLCLGVQQLPAQKSPVQVYIDAFWREADLKARNPSFNIVASKVSERAIEGISKPRALHHIRGSILVPGGSLEAIVRRLRDYSTHGELFAPTVKTSALCGKEGDDVFVFRYWSTPYMDSVTETRAVHRRLDDKRYAITSTTTGLGSPGDLKDRGDLCSGTLPGVFYMKQLHAVWRYEQTAEGVQIEGEIVAELSGFALVRSTVRRVLAQVMSQSLGKYREKFAQNPPLAEQAGTARLITAASTQFRDLGRCQFPPFADFQRIDANRPYAGPDKLAHPAAHRFDHPANLAVPAFGDRDLQETRACGFPQQSDLGRPSNPVLQFDTVTEPLQRWFV